MKYEFEIPFNIGDKVIIRTNGGSFIEATIRDFYCNGGYSKELKWKAYLTWSDVKEKHNGELLTFDQLYTSPEEAYEALEKEHFDNVTEKEASL